MHSERNDLIKKTHKVSFKGFFSIMKERKPYNKTQFYIAIAVSLLVTIYSCLNKDSYKILIAIVSSNMSIFPSLCGFSLTSYVLAINLGNISFFKQTAKLGKTSFYQNSIAVFAYTVFFEIITLSLSYLCKTVDQFPQIQFSSSTAHVINCTGIFLLSFLTIYSIVMIFYFVANIFTFGQTISMYNTMDKFKEEDKKPS